MESAREKLARAFRGSYLVRSDDIEIIREDKIKDKTGRRVETFFAVLSAPRPDLTIGFYAVVNGGYTSLRRLKLAKKDGEIVRHNGSPVPDYRPMLEAIRDASEFDGFCPNCHTNQLPIQTWNGHRTFINTCRECGKVIEKIKV